MHVVRWIAGAVVLTSLGAPSGLAQGGAASREFARQGQRAPATSSSGLERIISLDLSRVSLQTALDEIAAKAELKLLYRSGHVAGQSLVTLKVPRIRASEALERVLVGTGLTVVEQPNGRVVITDVPPRKPGGTSAVVRGVILGRVTDAKSGIALQGVTVSVEGTTLGGITDDAGRYRIASVEAGRQTVSARRLGYGRQVQQITVMESDTTVADFALEAATTTLTEVVTTVTGEQRRLEVGNAIGRIAADSLVREAAVSSFGDVLTARVAGVQIVPADGSTGSSPRIRVRGINSASVSNDPLLIVDGARVEGGPATTVGTYGSRPGRLNDLNPEEIESIEVVKGPSAATLYGTDAANGVIVVKTKRGRPGRTGWAVYGERGLIDLATPFQTNYYSWGRNRTTNAVQQCMLLQAAANVCTIDSLTTYHPFNDPAASPIANGSRYQVGVQASGGVTRFSYFLSGERESETGYLKMPESEQARVRLERGGTAIPDEQIRPNALERTSLRGNVSVSAGSNAEISLSTGLVSSYARNPSANPYQGAGFGAGHKSLNGGYNTSFGSKPGEGFGLRSAEDATRFTGSSTGNYRPASWLATRATVGLDFSSAFFDGLQRRGEGPIGADRNGRRMNTRTNVTLSTGDLSATASYGVSEKISARTTAGGQYNRRLELVTGTTATGLPPGSETVTGAATITGNESTVETVVAGGFVEQSLSWNDRVYLTGAVRADGGSTFGNDFSVAFYPKASLSWVALQGGAGPLSSFRVRAAYGASGVQPRPTTALALLTLSSALTDGVATTGALLRSIGNPDLRPELQREVETGIDATMLADRVQLELTYYSRTSENALFDRPLPSSIGILTRQENLGSVSNSGLEGQINARLVDRRALSWEVAFNGSVNRNRIEELAPGVANVTSTSTDRGLKVGYAIFGRFAPRITSVKDLNGNGIIEVSEVTVGDTAEFIGGSIPTRQLSASTAVGLLGGRVRLSTLFDYRGGHRILSLMEVNRCQFAGSCRGNNDPTASLEEQSWSVAFNSPALRQSRWGYYRDGTFVRWREIAATLQVPSRFARYLRASDATLTLTGRNITIFTDYDGTDPEGNTPPSSSTAVSTEGYTDNPVAPPPRYWTLRLNMRF